MILESRKKYLSSDTFRDEFLGTITPGIIPRGNFIAWNEIDIKFDKYQPAFEFYKELGRLSRTDEEFTEQLLDGLTSSDDPHFLVNTGFELLGHTSEIYVSDKDYLKLKTLQKKKLPSALEDKTKLLEPFVDVLYDLGLRSVVSNMALENYFIGVQVGLESHRRKNIGGETFKQIIGIDLKTIIQKLNIKGYQCELIAEYKILYSDAKTSKKVDFCIISNKKTLGIEVNFYTASGSKPTEIKRSYGQVKSELDKVGASLIWITDGAGYFDMKNSLMEAWDIHKNTYNLKMSRENLEDDIERYLTA